MPEHHSDSSYALPNSVLSGGMTHVGAATSMTDDISQRASDLGITVQEAKDLQEGDVKVLFHPASGKPYEIITADVYQRRAEVAKDFPWLDPEPWRRSFGTRDNFELAEFVLDAALNDNLTNRLFKIIERVRQGISDLTYTSARELNNAWAVATAGETQVRRSTYRTRYRQTQFTV